MRLASLFGFLSISIGGAVLYAAQAPAARPPAEGVWAEKARMFDLRSEVATAFLNGKVYVMGGLARNQEASTLNQEYDIATDIWRERRAMPFPLSHPNATTLNGKIHVVGGFLAQVHVAAQDSNFEYDPAADTWRILAPLRTPRGSVGVVALNGKIHAIGGRTVDRVTSAVHEIYDPATNMWTAGAPLPKARDHFAAVAANGKIHIIGGRFNLPVDNTNMHDIYDPATNSWTSGPPLPTARSGGAATLYKGMIVVAGGECRDFKPFVETEGFEVATGRWRTLASMPIGKHGITGTTDGQVMYIPGGNPECGLSMSHRMVTFTLP
jgi:N-acetylneuraminic acid mutarotase